MKIFDRVFNKNYKAVETKCDKVYLPCNVLFGNLKREKIEKNIEKSLKGVQL